MDQAERVRSVLCDELIMLGHVVTEQKAAVLDVSGTQVVVAARDGGVRITFEGGQYTAAPAEINWALLVSTVSAVATKNRASKGTKR